MQWDLFDILLLIHVVATCFMTGLIWFVQIVHYPLMSLIPRDLCIRYANKHQARTTRVVAPAMVLEVLTGIFISILAPEKTIFIFSLIGLALIAIIWLSTFFIQVPQHRRLSDADMNACGPLVKLNWIRTVAWSARAILVLVMLALETR